MVLLLSFMGVGLGLGMGGCATPGPAAGSAALASPAPAHRDSPVAAAATAGASSAYDLSHPDTLPPRLDLPLVRRGGYLLVPGTLDGQDIGLMMIDTGASLAVLARGVAGRLALTSTTTGRTVGVGGFETFPYHDIHTLSIGSPAFTSPTPQTPAPGTPPLTPTLTPTLTLPATRVAALELRPFGRALGVSLGGIVAYPDLAAVPFTLDPAAARLTVHRPNTFRPPAGATRHRLDHHRRLPIITATLTLDRQRIPVDLLIDTGADNALTLPASLLSSYPRLASVPAAGAGRTRGVGGHVDSTHTWLRRVDLLGLTLHDLPVAFEVPPPGLASARLGRPLGRVGNALLQHFQLTFHPSHSYLYAVWQPSD